MIILVVVLLIVAGCSPKTTPSPTTDANANQSPDTKTGDKTVTVTESSLEYCKTLLKSAQTKVTSYERQKEITAADIDEAQKKIEDLKEKKAEQDQIADEEKDLALLKDKLAEVEKGWAEAKKKLAEANDKCAKMAKKADKTICKEFKDDVDKQTKDSQTALTKEQTNLDNIKKQYDSAQAAGKSSEFLTSIEEEKEKQDLKILKINNNIDKLKQMLEQLTKYCG